MSRIRSCGGQPELFVRSLLSDRAEEVQCNVKALPGRPDLVLPEHSLAVFVHGCFWHQHPGCKRSKLPSTNVQWWSSKLGRNALRDQQAVSQLAELGWRVVTLWQCELRKKDMSKRVLIALGLPEN